MPIKNIIIVVVSILLGIILFLVSIALWREFVDSSSPSYSVLIPSFLSFISAIIVAWFTSKNWVVTAIVFGFFVLFSYVLYGGTLEHDMPNLEPIQ